MWNWGIKTVRDGNIFREAKELLKTKLFSAMTGEEVIMVKAAMIPLDILPQFKKKTVDEGLEELAKIFDEASQAEADHPEGTRRLI